MNDIDPKAMARSANLQPSWSSVNVVCVTYNNQETAIPLLRSLLHESAHISEVIIHDNGSSDETVSTVDSWMASNPGPRVRTVVATNVGFSAGVHGACVELEDPNLPTLCLNPDAILSAGTVAALLKILNENAEVGIVTAPLVMSDGQLDPSSVRRLPKFGSAILYSLLGKLLPRRFRYNASELSDVRSAFTDAEGVGFTKIEATTGALMLVNPLFRVASRPIFDLSYWMYGEDLQLCKDAAEEGFIVAMANYEPSVHIKGISSGWPRSLKSNMAFHDAMFLYFSKNFSRNPYEQKAGRIAVMIRFGISEIFGLLERIRKRFVRSS